MFVSERLNEILKLIEKKGKVEVNHLSNLFKVSKDLIRKDLSKLFLFFPLFLKYLTLQYHVIHKSFQE